MEYEQIQTGVFKDGEKGKPRIRLIFITAFVLIFFTGGGGYSFWYLLSEEREASIEREEKFKTQLLENHKTEVKFKESLTLLDKNVRALSKRVDDLEQNVVHSKNSKAEKSAEKREFEAFWLELESLRNSFELRLLESQSKSTEVRHDALILAAIESDVIRANRYLTRGKDPLSAYAVLSNVKTFTKQLSPNLRSMLNELLSKQILRLEKLSNSPFYQLPMKLNRLSILVSDIKIETEEKRRKSPPVEIPIPADYSSEGVIQSLWDDVKTLVTVTEVNNELVNRFSSNDARLIKLTLQLEISVARASFFADKPTLLEASLNNLNKLVQTYLVGAVSIVELLRDIDGVDVMALANEDRNLTDLAGKIRELHMSQGFSN